MQMSAAAKNLFNQACYIDGDWVTSNDWIKVLNPATNEVFGRVPDLNSSHTHQAIEAAAKALKSWQQSGIYKRAKIISQWKQLILENKQALAEIIVWESGKPLAEAIGEIHYGCHYLGWFIETTKRSYDRVIPAANPKQRMQTTRQGIGVCAAITPWNFPMAMLARKMAPALMAGCTLVVKPSELTPFSALALAQFAHQAQLPKGVFNIITGEADAIGQTLCQHNGVRKLSFTGSIEVGKKLLQQSAATIKNVSLELGGNAPFIVFADANLSKAVDDLITNKFRNCGQTCISANRILIADEIYDEFCQKLLQAMKSLKVGPGLDEGVNVGPLINAKAIGKVQTLVTDAIDKGAILLTGGKEVESCGNFFQPTVLSEISQSMDISHAEIFGPIIALQRFHHEQQALQIANGSDYGLASYFYTENLSRSIRVAEALEYGMVGINDTEISAVEAPFGGFKHSGLGKEGGEEGLDGYLQTKYICTHIGAGSV